MPAPPHTATILPPVPPLHEAASPRGIQPGGGWCIDAEARWDRWRRRWLRSAQSRYVATMATKRQGHCPDCRHDIIDARDLKLVRNDCGYWFRPEDDPFRWRDRLGLARAGFAEVVIASLTCVALLVPLAVWWGISGGLGPAACAALVAVLWFQAVWFFRDPHRAVSADPAALASPADGLVTHLDEVEAIDFPGGRAFRISIYLSPFDVHLNRAPRPARVTGVRYFRGCFLNARHPQCVVRNEQLWVDMVEPNGRCIRIKQISGAMARRLVCWARVGEDLQAGQRYGLIKYGSRTDILLPADDARELLVKVGDRLLAGTSVLLRFVDGGDRADTHGG